MIRAFVNANCSCFLEIIRAFFAGILQLSIFADKMQILWNRMEMGRNNCR